MCFFNVSISLLFKSFIQYTVINYFCWKKSLSLTVTHLLRNDVKNDFVYVQTTQIRRRVHQANLHLFIYSKYSQVDDDDVAVVMMMAIIIIMVTKTIGKSLL